MTESATIGSYSTPDCSGNPENTYTTFNDVCTANLGTAITLYDCSDSYVKVILFEDSFGGDTPPKCGTGDASYIDAKRECTYFKSAEQYTKIIESTCKSNPSTLFMASLYSDACPVSAQLFSTIIADGTCRVFLSSSYAASIGTSNTINYKYYNALNCNSSEGYSSLDNVPTNGVCTDATSPGGDVLSMKVAIPAAYYYSPINAKDIAGVIAGAVAGVLVCCCGFWGILHACGCVNCPCYNRCCDRRKNIASSGSSPSFPASAYGANAPRSSPYGNTRL